MYPEHIEVRTWVVYVLLEPDSDEPRYVGRTRLFYLEERYRMHVNYPNRSTRAWIEALANAGRRPVLRVLQFVLSPQREVPGLVEKFWIHHLVARGASLLNEKSAPKPFEREALKLFLAKVPAFPYAPTGTEG